MNITQEYIQRKALLYERKSYYKERVTSSKLFNYVFCAGTIAATGMAAISFLNPDDKQEIIATVIAAGAGIATLANYFFGVIRNRKKLNHITEELNTLENKL